MKRRDHMLSKMILDIGRAMAPVLPRVQSPDEAEEVALLAIGAVAAALLSASGTTLTEELLGEVSSAGFNAMTAAIRSHVSKSN